MAMHTALYRDHSDVGCVVHAHPPYATAFAVLNREIGRWAEAVARIRAAVRPGVPAVLLAHVAGLERHDAGREGDELQRRDEHVADEAVLDLGAGPALPLPVDAGFY